MLPLHAVAEFIFGPIYTLQLNIVRVCMSLTQNLFICLGGFVRRDDPKGRVTILGIISANLGCKTQGSFGIYTDVRMQMDWINKRLRNK